MKNIPILYIVVPCYNEESVIPVTAKFFYDKLMNLIMQDLISSESRILFVDDGSSDNTWNIIQSLQRENVHYCGISLSKNRGHQNALWAGLMTAKDKCDIAISLDCDGQDDINTVDKMLEQYKNGHDIVYGVRQNRDSDTFFKKITAEMYYKVLRFIGANIIYNHADYRLVSARVLKELSNFREVNLFLRGIFPMLGFKSTKVYYDRAVRISGNTHYSIKKMLGLAVEGITSLSIQPLRCITFTGLFISCLSFIGVIWACIMFFSKSVVSGWASLICSILFIGGIQITFLGIIGEYLGKIYMETKQRPRYIISDKTENL